MCKKQTSWLLWIGSLCLLATGLQAQFQQIKMTRIGPQVQVQDMAGQQIKIESASDGDLVNEQDMVLTLGAGSRVILVFSNGATINIAEESRVEIRQFTQDPFAEDYSFANSTEEPPSISTTRIHLTEGELVGNVKSLRNGSSFEVSTPAGAAGIRGTTFRVVFRPRGDGTAFFTVTTVEGDVAVTTTEGTVSTPISVTDSEEIEILVEVDDETGEVTVISQPADIVVTTASTEVVASVTEAVQEAAQAVVDVVLVVDTSQQQNAGSGSDGGQEGGGNSDDDDQGGGGSDGSGDNQEGGGGNNLPQNQTPTNQNTTDNPSPTAGG